MKRREGYKGFVIEARVQQLKDSRFSSDFSVEEHDGSGVNETQFFVQGTFSTPEAAIDAALQAGRSKVDRGSAPSR